MPTVAVLVNNYNNGRWLRECVDSVLAQSRPVDEIIVYDDGSSDESVSVLRGYGERIKLIEGVHRHDRSGIASQAAAVAAAFFASTAEHLYLLDGDDRYKVHHVESCEARWKAEPDAIMVQCAMVTLDAESRPLGPHWSARLCQKVDYRREIYRKKNLDFFCPTSALAFRRDFLLGALPVEMPQTGLTSAADIRLCWAAALAGRILFVSEPGVDYRTHSAGMSATTGQRLQSRRKNAALAIGDFNLYARRHRYPLLRPWLHVNFYLQWCRALAPKAVGDFCAELKIRLTSRQERRGQL
jgi:glycosyltransferase involved in cell wall biosynthesis